MGGRPRGHHFGLRQEEAQLEGLRGRAGQVQHGPEPADHREDRVPLRLHPDRLRAPGRDHRSGDQAVDLDLRQGHASQVQEGDGLHCCPGNLSKVSSFGSVKLNLQSYDHGFESRQWDKDIDSVDANADFVDVDLLFGCIAVLHYAT